ncbi:hypothetical protein ACTJIL_05340 [Luteimonas sp. 22616]|uniref:hypothetical protein n=1 Tax=Luteimonas sp. 22616 TaxID=3453951 RepID=UPI003F83CC75
MDTWDAYFRRRVGNDLREHTIDETWARVAQEVAGTESEGNDSWSRRYISTFRKWRLLPDERLLSDAHAVFSGMPPEPAAVLNAAVFVLDPRTEHARFDADGFAIAAALAVRFLDDASLASPQRAGEPPCLRIGMLGVADAVSDMGMAYGSADAVRQAAAMAAALATGCLQGTVALAVERSPYPDAPLEELTAIWRGRGMPPELIEAAHRHGVRHLQLTAIDPHPLLARLANDASDGVDPKNRSVLTTVCRPTYPMSASSAGMARERLDAMRRAVQPWIDIEIDSRNEGVEELQALGA